LNRENLLEYSKTDFVKSIIETIIDNIVVNDSPNTIYTNASEREHQISMDSQENDEIPESLITKDSTESPILEPQRENTEGTEKCIAKRRLKKKVKRLSRKQLEKVLTEKTQELIKAQSEVGKLQTTCYDLKKDIKEWKEKSDNLAKSCSNLAKLVKLNIEGNDNRPKDKKTSPKCWDPSKVGCETSCATTCQASC